MSDPRAATYNQCLRTANVAEILADELADMGLHDEALRVEVILELIHLKALDMLSFGPIVEHHAAAV